MSHSRLLKCLLHVRLLKCLSHSRLLKCLLHSRLLKCLLHVRLLTRVCHTRISRLVAMSRLVVMSPDSCIRHKAHSYVAPPIHVHSYVAPRTHVFICRTTQSTRARNLRVHLPPTPRAKCTCTHVTISSSFTHLSPSPLGTHEGGRAAVAPSPRAPATDSPRLTYMSQSLCGSFMSATARDLSCQQLLVTCACAT